MPILAKEDLYGYFIPKILKHHKDENFVSNFETRHDRVNNIILNKNLNSENEINIEDRLSVANNNFAESLTLIIEYPLVSLKEYGLSLLHYVLLKPNEIHYLIENTTLYDGQFYNSKKFNDEKVIKTIYSIIIYSISLIGLICSKKKKIVSFFYFSFQFYISLYQ